jgi:HEAT repeat protein
MTFARPWYGMRALLASAAPLRLTFWVVVVGAAVIVTLIGLGVARHLGEVRAERRREHVHKELQPMFSQFLRSEDATQLAEELRPAFLRMDAAHRPAAAWLTIDVMREASPSQKAQLRRELELAGIVELTERGTRRLSPWRRALACEVLGEIGADRSVPCLLVRLQDRRPEVRFAAVRALGLIGSVEAVPALSKAFLERRVAPTNVVNNALRQIGGAAAPAFEEGIMSDDPIVRVSSCFGFSGIAEEHDVAVVRLAEVLASDSDPRVRAAAGSALGIVGGTNAPRQLLDATTDPNVQVRRSAVKALASFDDPTTGDVLVERAEDEDRETAIRAAEALFALTRRPRAAAEARTHLERCPGWSVEYARKVAEVTA